MTDTAIDPFGNTDVPEKYRSAVLSSALRWGIPPPLLAAQINQESSFDPNAESEAGAIGIAQFMPTTAEELGIDPRQPFESIDGMARLMRDYYRRFGSWEKALYAYHGGPNAVNDPGPNSLAYAKDILSKVAGIVTDAATLPIIENPLSSIQKLLQRFQDRKFLQRIGVGGLGIAIVILAVISLVIKRGSNGISSIAKN